MKRWWQKRWRLYLLAAVAVLGGSFYTYYRYTFPYGRSHHCSKQLSTALKMYAGDHGGRYPAGESSPEASLSLLYPKYISSAAIFSGKTLPESPTVQRLESGQRLTPETCGWHYVEGLREDSDSRLMLLWDKVGGLGHNGQRMDGGREVVFVDHSAKYIHGPEWPALLAQQEKLRASQSK